MCYTLLTMICGLCECKLEEDPEEVLWRCWCGAGFSEEKDALERTLTKMAYERWKRSRRRSLRDR